MAIVTRLVCEECGNVTEVEGFATVWWCWACDRPTATIWEHKLSEDGVTTVVREGSVVNMKVRERE